MAQDGIKVEHQWCDCWKWPRNSHRVHCTTAELHANGTESHDAVGVLCWLIRTHDPYGPLRLVIFLHPFCLMLVEQHTTAPVRYVIRPSSCWSPRRPITLNHF